MVTSLITLSPWSQVSDNVAILTPYWASSWPATADELNVYSLVDLLCYGRVFQLYDGWLFASCFDQIAFGTHGVNDFETKEPCCICCICVNCFSEFSLECCVIGPDFSSYETKTLWMHAHVTYIIVWKMCIGLFMKVMIVAVFCQPMRTVHLNC